MTDPDIAAVRDALDVSCEYHGKQRFGGCEYCSWCQNVEDSLDRLEARLREPEAERDEAMAHAARSLTGWQGAVALAEAAEAERDYWKRNYDAQYRGSKLESAESRVAELEAEVARLRSVLAGKDAA